MNTELILYLWAMLPLHAVSHFVRLHRSEKEYPLLVLNFDSETFQRIHGSEILSQLKQKKKSQLCIIKILFKNSFVALESTPRCLFMFTITLEETWRKQLPNLCSIHRLDENKHSEQLRDLGGFGSKTKASMCKSTLSPDTAILLQDVVDSLHCT